MLTESCFWKLQLHEPVLQGALLTKPMKICSCIWLHVKLYTLCYILQLHCLMCGVVGLCYKPSAVRYCQTS